jgi:hypothetical protein
MNFPFLDIELIRINRRGRLAEGVGQQQPGRRHVAGLGLLDELARHFGDVFLGHGLAQRLPQRGDAAGERIARPAGIPLDKSASCIASEIAVG